MLKRKSLKSEQTELSDNLSDNSKPVSVEVVESQELTEDEQRLRLHLERKVERAFYEAGKALMELRDKLLFRNTHKTFEEYCRDRFGFERRHPKRLIDAAIVVDNLSQMCPIWTQNETELTTELLCPNGTQILPTNECQVRPLTKLEPEQQQQAWQQAVEVAGGKVPSGRIVKDAVHRIMQRTRVPNPYRVGEVCQFVVKDNPDLRGKSGCWCIVNRIGDFSCTVTSWDGDYTVSTDHLKSLEYSDSDCEQMKQISHRITRLRNQNNLTEV